MLKADHIEYDNKKLYVFFEKMDMSLTDYIKKHGRSRGQNLDESTEIQTIMK